MKIIALWMFFAMGCVWIVSGIDLRAYGFPPLFPSGQGISAAMHDHKLGLWAYNIGVLFGMLCAGNLLVSWLKPDQSRVHNWSQYWLKLVPLSLVIAVLLALMLTADLSPGTGFSRGATLFRLLSANTFGVGVLASLLTFFFGILFCIPVQTIRIGYHLFGRAA